MVVAAFLPVPSRNLAALIFAIITSAACAGSQGSPPSATASPAPDEPAPSLTASSAAAAENAPNVEPATPSQPQPEPGPPPPNPVELCNQMCDRVAERCTASAAESCRINCTQYEHPPAGCDDQVRTALECAAKAEDLTCVNIAPESCAGDFRRVVACASGKPEGAMPEDPNKMPEGWQPFQSSAAGFSAPMPKGVSEKSEDSQPAFSVSAGDATYGVRILPAPSEKPTQKNLVRVAMKLLGNCTRKLKLFSMVERPDRVTIRFESRCPDGAERHGLLVIAAGKMYVLEVSGPAGFKAPKDPFFYGFDLKQN